MNVVEEAQSRMNVLQPWSWELLALNSSRHSPSAVSYEKRGQNTYTLRASYIVDTENMATPNQG